MVPFTPCTCDQIHGPIYTLYLCLLLGQMHGPIYTLFILLSVLGSNPWSALHPVLVMKSKVPFTPCTCVCCGVKCVIPFTPYTSVCFGVKSMVCFTPCTCDEIHGPIYNLYFCLLWGLIHAPIYTLYVCLLCGQFIGPIYTL